MENINQETLDKTEINTGPVSAKKPFLKPIYLLIVAVLIIALLIIGWVFFMPKPKTPQKVTNNTPKTVSAQEAVTKAGYGIFWQGDKNDKTGRNIIADDTRKTSTTHYDSVGLNYAEENPENIMMALGVFKGWEAIENSTDTYILLENPINKKILKGRLTFSASSLNSVSNPSGQKNVTTALMVEDLNYGPKTEKDWINDYVSRPLEENSLALFEKAIKVGDVVAVRTILENMPGYQIVRKDDKGVSVVSKVVIRRFGGSSQLLKELK